MSRPFANGTEGSAWTSAWCDHCVHDHEMHPPTFQGPGCSIICESMFASDEDWAWPECWLAVPDDYWRHLPARIACLKFEACACGPDPAGDERAEYVESIRVDLMRGAS